MPPRIHCLFILQMVHGNILLYLSVAGHSHGVHHSSTYSNSGLFSATLHSYFIFKRFSYICKSKLKFMNLGFEISAVQDSFSTRIHSLLHMVNLDGIHRDRLMLKARGSTRQVVSN